MFGWNTTQIWSHTAEIVLFPADNWHFGPILGYITWFWRISSWSLFWKWFFVEGKMGGRKKFFFSKSVQKLFRMGF